ncbi:hypothetical protein Y032_0101g3382 [Ancylostoma ceylanicum]|uniref:SCP domain-containing protein n=1 Tax=Ancylostoma ceylanicum TaxID=53326 RepID=A0A016TI04_9BILA|nr:hypothetical protein Y032_0101g3382 [Ancylostoma ceylanicum]
MNALFVVLASVGLRVLYAEQYHGRKIVIDRPNACKQPVNLRTVFDDFHNNFRQKVAAGMAFGDSYPFQQRLMYGLIYDCALEKKANKEVRNPGSVKDLAVVSFTRDYDFGLPKAVKEGFEEAIQDTRVLKQIIYPKATRFACARNVTRGNGGKNRVGVACVYDKKADSNAFDSKGPCLEDKDCTFFGGKCQWFLCYVPLKKA